MSNNETRTIRDLAPNSEWVDVMDELNEVNVNQHVILACINEKGDNDPENATGVIPDDADWKTIATCLALRYLQDFAPECTMVVMKPQRRSDGLPTMEALAATGVVESSLLVDPNEDCITKQLKRRNTKNMH